MVFAQASPNGFGDARRRVIDDVVVGVPIAAAAMARDEVWLVFDGTATTQVRTIVGGIVIRAFDDPFDNDVDLGGPIATQEDGFVLHPLAAAVDRFADGSGSLAVIGQRQRLLPRPSVPTPGIALFFSVTGQRIITKRIATATAVFDQVTFDAGAQLWMASPENTTSRIDLFELSGCNSDVTP